jgi:hypothetical protein
MELTVMVQANGDTNDMSMWEGLIRCRVEDVTGILLSLTTVKEVMVSINTVREEGRPGEVPSG